MWAQFVMGGLLVAGVAGVLVGVHAEGKRSARAECRAEHLARKEAARDAAEVAARTAAEAISRIEVKHVTIRQSSEQIIREVPVYAECRHDPRVVRDIDEARTGTRGPEPAGGGQLPAASAPAR